MKIIRYLVLIFSFVLSVYSQETGIQAPIVEGKDFAGKDIKLSDFSGKVVILDFWASWCAPCRIEMPYLVELHEMYKDNGLVIIGINIDDKSSNAAKFISGLSKKPEFSFIWDKEKKYPVMLGIESMPTTLIIDRKGIIRFRHNGFTPDVKESFKEEIQKLISEKI